jgi:hypothetical protein
MLPTQLFDRLKSSPAFLLLGQDYLKFNSGKDLLLHEFCRHYKISSVNPSYESILNVPGVEESKGQLAFMQQICDRLTSPEWLDIVGSFQWHGVYTSAIDTIWLQAFRNSWRELQHIYNEEYNPENSNNTRRLNCTYLYGCINQTDPNKTPPLTDYEMDIRDGCATALAKRMSDAISLLGVLLIESYAGDRDWFTPKHLVQVVDKLLPGQAHLFSVTEELRCNQRLSKLSQSGKLVLHSESLATYLLETEDAGYIQLGEPDEYIQGHKITIKRKKRPITFPLTDWNQVSRSAIILDDLITENALPIRSKETRYYEFKNFLAESGNQPIWSGYDNGFAFKRDFESKLKDVVVEKLSSHRLQDEPIILSGEAGTGKSVALARLAYDIRKDGEYPVLFIKKQSRNPITDHLIRFCQWAEEEGASAVLIVWDGMKEPEEYYKLSNRFATLARRTVVVGSCYSLVGSNNYHNHIISPAILNNTPISGDSEFNRFLQFAEDNIPESRNYIESLLGQDKKLNRFLVALYRLLPPVRSQIRSSLTKSVYYATSGFNDENTSFIESDKHTSSLGLALLKAFDSSSLENKAGLIPLVTSNDSEYTGDQNSKLKRLVLLVMVPGQVDVSVPINVLSQAINQGGFLSEFYELFNRLRANVIEILDDDYVSSRHRLEAELFTQSEFGGNPAREMEYVKQILLSVRGGRGIDFALEFVKRIGPNSKFLQRGLGLKPYFNDYWQEIGEILVKLREDYKIKAVLFREAVKGNSNDSLKLLEQAESVLQMAMELSEVKDSNSNLSIFLGEQASLIGTKATEIIKNEQTINNLTSSSQLNDLINESHQIAFQSFALNPIRYYPIDIIAWTSELVFKHQEKFSSLFQNTIKANVYYAFLRAEDINTFVTEQDQSSRFNERRLTIANLVGDQKLSDQAFQELADQGSGVGYFLRAYEIVKEILSAKPRFEILNNSQLESCQNAVKYLFEENYKFIRKERCALSLLIKLWWFSKTHKILFYQDKQTLAFSKEDWQNCLKIVDDLISVDERENLTLQYLRGLAHFHLNRVTSKDIFEKLEHEEVYGSRRNFISYIASDSQGNPILYNGAVESWNDKIYKTGSGKVYVDELMYKISFTPKDFFSSVHDLKKGETIKFYIGFNFRGTIAVSPNLLDQKF